MASKRDKFIALSKRGGGRKDFVKLAFEEGLTNKETPAPVKKDNLATKAFAKASSLDIEGEKKTDIFKNLNKLNKAGKLGSKLIPGVGVASTIFGADELGASERMSDELKSELNQMEEYGEKKDSDSEGNSFKKGGRVKKAKGGLIRGFPKIAKRGY
jgi:hypothetical protein